MSFFGRLFSSDDAVTSLVDNVSTGIGKLIYTDEEKSDDARADRSEARKMIIQWLANTQGQNLSRRIISLSITFVWLGSYVMSLVLRICAVFTNNSGTVTADKLLDVAQLTKDAALEMNPAVMLILAFYFAAPHMGAIVGKAMDGFSKIGKKP